MGAAVKRKMIKMEYSYVNIDIIDSEGIRFRDGREIAFQVCVQEYQKQFPGSTSGAGMRDITGQPPYFEFFMPEHIRIVFDKKGPFGKRRNLKDFIQMYELLLRYGYKTYDLS